jgi:hypothetical protein
MPGNAAFHPTIKTMDLQTVFSVKEFFQLRQLVLRVEIMLLRCFLNPSYTISKYMPYVPCVSFWQIIPPDCRR